MATIKVSIVEDNEKVISNLTELFSHQSDFLLLEIYNDADSAVQNVFKNQPDILILDIGLPGKSGISILEELKTTIPEMKIVMYTVFEDEDNIIQAIKKGANGYLLKDTPLDLLVAELKVIQLGGSPLTPRIAARIIHEFNSKLHNTDNDIEESNLLSNREKEVLNLVSLGLVYSDIADELDISPHTVSRHVENIYKKLNVHSKSQAIIRGRRLGIIQDGKYQI